MANLRTQGQGLALYIRQFGYYPGGWAPSVDVAAAQQSGPNPRPTVAIWPTRIRFALGGGNTEANRRLFYCPASDEWCQWPVEVTAARPPAIADDAGLGYEPGEPLLMLGAQGIAPPEWGYPYGRFSYGYNTRGAAPGGFYDVELIRGLGDFIYYRPRDGTSQPTSRQIRADRVKLPSAMIAIADRRPTQVNDGPHVYSLFPADDGHAHGTPAGIHQGGANVLYCDGHVQWHVEGELTFAYRASPTDEKYLRVAPLWNSNHAP